MLDKRRTPFGEVEIDDDKQLMYVRYGPDSQVHDWKKSLKEVLQISEETGIYRVLVDVRKQEKLANTLDLYDFGAGLPKHIAFAVLCELHLADHRFIENVAMNRGIQVKDFNMEEDAISWLLEWPNHHSGRQ